MADGIPLDPYEILGVGPDARAEEVREAFRRKSKIHHPDRGGEEWAFRIVTWAYERLGSGSNPPNILRIYRVSEVEAKLRPAEAPQPEPHAASAGSFGPTRAGTKDWATEAERIRPGVQDRDIEPSHLVEVEILWMRYEVEDVFDLLNKHTSGERNLSGSLHIRWPAAELGDEAPLIPDAPKILTELRMLYEWLRVRPDVLNARVQTDKAKFEAWLNYSSGQVAWSAFKALRPAINAAGLGVKQWTRDLTIPRESNSSY